MLQNWGDSDCMEYQVDTTLNWARLTKQALPSALWTVCCKLFLLLTELIVASGACFDHYLSSVCCQRMSHFCTGVYTYRQLFFLPTLSAPFQWYFVLNVSAGSSLRCKRRPIPRTSVCVTVPTCQLLTTEFWAVCSWDGLTKVYWRWWHESMQQEIINKWTIYIKLKIKKINRISALKLLLPTDKYRM